MAIVIFLKISLRWVTIFMSSAVFPCKSGREPYFASILQCLPISIRSRCERRLTFVSHDSGGWRIQRKYTGRFSKSLPSHFSQSTAAGIPGSVACRASIRSFAAPCAQCQEVSRPEFTLTHSIRSFVRAGKKKKRLDQRELVLPWFSYRACSPFCVSFLWSLRAGVANYSYRRILARYYHISFERNLAKFIFHRVFFFTIEKDCNSSN